MALAGWALPPYPGTNNELSGAFTAIVEGIGANPPLGRVQQARLVT